VFNNPQIQYITMFNPKYLQHDTEFLIHTKIETHEFFTVTT